jgi:hypothetical protein
MQAHSPTAEDSTAEVHHRFDPHTDSVVDEVLAAVAGMRDLDLTEAAPLAEVVDPDALEELFDPVSQGLADVAGYVVFTYEGLKVTVRSEGLVRVARLAA